MFQIVMGLQKDLKDYLELMGFNLEDLYPLPNGKPNNPSNAPSQQAPVELSPKPNPQDFAIPMNTSANILDSEAKKQVSVQPHQELPPMPKKPAGLEYFSSKHSDANWETLQSLAHDCKSCKLAPTRTNVVFGAGNPKAEIMFVGEGPGAEEDAQGLPFVGRSGQLLTKMIEAMGIKRSDVFIANVVKCRPPMNRNPEPDEIAECSPFLRRQVELVGPKVIVALGTFAAQLVLETEEPIGQLRGKFHFNPSLKNRSGQKVKIMPTYHPAFCLRNPHMKKPVWEDLQVVMRDLGLESKTNFASPSPSTP